MAPSFLLAQMPADVQNALAHEVSALRTEVEKLFGRGTCEAIALLAAFEDAVQAAMLRALENVHTLQGPRPNMRAWMLTVAQNLRTDIVRRARREQALVIRDEIAVAMAPTRECSPETLVMLRETCGRVAAAMERVDATSKRAFLLFHFDGLTHAEVGAALGISEAASKMRCSRIHERLMKEIGEDALDMLNDLRGLLPPIFFENRRAELHRAVRVQRALETTRRASTACATLLAATLAFNHVERLPLAQHGPPMPTIRVDMGPDKGTQDAPPASQVSIEPISSKHPPADLAGSKRAPLREAKAAIRLEDDVPFEGISKRGMYMPSAR